MSSLYRDEKDGENIGIIVENTNINGREINLEWVIITFNHRFSVFNVWRFASGIDIDLGPQQTLNTSNR